MRSIKIPLCEKRAAMRSAKIPHGYPPLPETTPQYPSNQRPETEKGRTTTFSLSGEI
jgi:hypothetical protein